jgi:hypothetical protein
VKVKASLQIRVFGGSDWVHSPDDTPLNEFAPTAAKGKDDTTALSVPKRVGFSIPPSSSPASASSSSSSAVSNRANTAILKPSQEQRLRDLTDTQSTASRDRSRERDGDSRGKKPGGIEIDRADAAGRPGGTPVPFYCM